MPTVPMRFGASRLPALHYSSEMAALKADIHPPSTTSFFMYGYVYLEPEREQSEVCPACSTCCQFCCLWNWSRPLWCETALLSAAIYLSSPLAILAAQFARMYSLLSFLSILSTWLYLQFLIKPSDSRLRFALYVFVNIVGTFTHIAIFFPLFAQIVRHLLILSPSKNEEVSHCDGTVSGPLHVSMGTSLVAPDCHGRRGARLGKRAKCFPCG